MLHKLILLAGVLCFSISGIAQKSRFFAPVNPEFYEYQKNLRYSDTVQSSSDKSFGYIPPYFKIEENITEFDQQTQLKAAISLGLPSKFDLRALKGVTSVKFQGGARGGNCWTFSSTGSIESNLTYRKIYTNKDTLSDGKPKEFNFSEQDMATCHGYEWKYGEGGNEFLALAYLNRFVGPVREEDSRYNVNSSNCVEAKNKTRVYSVPEMKLIYGNPVLTKQAIMNYGGVTTQMYYDDAFYNSKYKSYCFTGIQSSNHSVMIVGWDDEKETHVGKGAWICKNSWDVNWGEKGYFYLAYRDKRVIRPISYFPTIWEPSYVNNNYNYIQTGFVSACGLGDDTNFALIKYTTVKPQYIRKIGTMLLRTGSVVEIEIYDDKSGDTLKNLLSSYKGKPVESPGMYTFDIPTKVTDDFYVKIKYYTPGLQYSVPVEKQVKDYAMPDIELSGKQWISSDGKAWKAVGSDVKDWEVDFLIFAYATDDLGPKANFTISKNEVCAGSTVVFYDASAGDVNTYLWSFGSGATPAFATGPGPHTVTISDTVAPGINVAYLKVAGPQGSDVMDKGYKIVNRLLPLLITKDYAIIDDTLKINAVTDADTYIWFPTTNLTSSNTKEVSFLCNTPGKTKYTVKATQGICTGSGTIVVDVLAPPINDSICKAITLKEGDNGPFVNIDATVQFNEPAPVDTCCNCAKTWCDEGGLQNSVWFTYTVPSDVDRISIDTRGMDTQIAVYESSSCDSVKFSDLLVANDDYYDTKPFAAALESFAVKPGKTYYIQIDGSAGGDADTFYINMSRWELGIPQLYTKKGNLQIFPNPNNGQFKIKYSSPTSEWINYKVFDLTGKTVLEQNQYKQSGEVETNLKSNLPKGIYVVRAIGSNKTMTGKLIIE